MRATHRYEGEGLYLVVGDSEYVGVAGGCGKWEKRKEVCMESFVFHREWYGFWGNKLWVDHYEECTKLK